VITRRFFIKIIGGISIMMLTKNFSVAELQCSCCGLSDMDPDFMKILQNIRDEMKRPLKISSGVRCAKRNAQVSSTGSNGPHVPRKNGTAASDILIAGADALRMIDIARKHGVSGVGISQRGPHNRRFIHLDTITDHPRPTMWSY
jgi:zinc D-Ala-D-Ala carboxypeptidase